MSSDTNNVTQSSIKPIDKTSIHRITSGQVVIDLQTAVKELIENSLDAGATNIDVRFKQYGLTSIEVVDNGSGIAEEDHDSIGLKHHTSKLATYTDLTELQTFGFRGEALSSLCALCQTVQVTTSTHPPVGVCLDLDVSGRVKSRKTIARPKGTTVTLKGLFLPLPVRRKELERNIKREFAKALGLLNAYALLPCAVNPGIRLNVTNQPDKAAKTQLLTTQGSPSMRASVTALWGPKALDNIVDLDLEIEVEKEWGNRGRVASQASSLVDEAPLQVCVRGLISKFNVSCGRTGTDRQYFYVNGRPCVLNKVQKAFNEVYRSFNATQSPFIAADFVIPTDACDINVSPDKRMIFLHSESNLILALKAALEHHFNPARSTFDVTATQPKTVQASLDRFSTAPLKLSVTNNMSRFCPRPTSDDDQGEDPKVTDSPCSTSTASSGSDQVGSHAGGQPPASPKVPLFIPDPEDDLSPTNLDIENSADFHNEPMTAERTSEGSEPRDRHREGNPDQGIVIDTTRASWNRQSSPQAAATPQQLVVDGESTLPISSVRPQERDEEGGTVEVPRPDEEPPRKKRKSDGETLMSWITTKPASISGKSRTSAGVNDSVPTSAIGFAMPSKVRQGKLSMHNFLAGFASSSQPVNNGRTEGSADVEAEGDVEMEEEVRGTVEMENRLREGETQGSDSGTAVDESINVPVLSKRHYSPDLPPQNSPSTTDDHSEDDIFAADEDASVLSSVQQTLSMGSGVSREEQAIRPEIIRGGTDSETILKFDLEGVRTRWSKLAASKLAHQRPTARDSVDALEDAGLSNTDNEAKAAEVLSRIIDKPDFSTMEVVGQFNLGFIIARRRKSGGVSDSVMDDLFIVDQHAADEKYNFETLQQTTNIQSQKLFRPRPLELTASDELVATENIDILRKNGFEIDVDEAAISGSRLILAAQPVSKSTLFDMKDLEELIHLMQDRPNGQMVRCSKARAMFAMRACRKSVMIGMPLNRHQMLSVVRHMGMIDQPWNCPHGRPTMRHLVDLEGLERQKREVDWRRLTLDS